MNEAKKNEKASKKKEYYKILGIEKNADEASIKKAYKKLAMKWHPDKCTAEGEENKKHSEKMFRDISEAYSVLSDPEKRKMFDQGIDPNDPNSGMGGMNFGEGIDPDQIFQMFFRGGSGGGGGSGFTSGNMGGGSSGCKLIT